MIKFKNHYNKDIFSIIKLYNALIERENKNETILKNYQSI